MKHLPRPLRNHGARSVLAAAVLVAVAVASPFAEPGRVPGLGSAAAAPPHDAAAVVPGEVIVVYNDGLRASGAAEAVGGQTLARSETLGAERVALPAGVAIDDAIAELRKQPGVAYVEPNVRLTASALPNDPQFVDQRWYMTLIGAIPAWNRQVGNPEIVVAVIDTGVDAKHEDLALRLWVNTGETPKDGIDNDLNGCVDDVSGCNFVEPAPADDCGYTAAVPNAIIEDDAGHGTQVAGVLAAAGDNGKGIAGMAWNVRIMMVKGMDCHQGGTAFDVAAAVDYAVANGARIINLSLGGSLEAQVLTDALNRATQSGVLVVAAAGNGANAAVNYPARLPNVMGVSASDGQDAPDGAAGFTNWGAGIDVTAPGVQLASTQPESSYGTSTGSSFSTPLVAGLAALILAQNPTLTGEEVSAMIRESAQDLPDGSRPNWDGRGRIRADAALDRVPSTFRGVVTANNAQLAPGTTIEALIGPQLCGLTQTFLGAGGQLQYEIRVVSHAVQPGCGAPGAVIRFRATGQDAIATAAWMGTLQHLDLQLRVTVMALQQGWNLVAFPVVPASATPSIVLQPILPLLEVAFAFDAAQQQFLFLLPSDTGASTLHTLDPRAGLLLRMTAAAQLPLDGPPRPPGEPLSLVAGLNLIAPALTVAVPVSEALASIEGAYIAMFGFVDGPDGRYVPYVPEGPDSLRELTMLEPGKGYWLVMAEPAMLVIGAPPPAPAPTASPEPPTESPTPPAQASSTPAASPTPLPTGTP